MAENEALKKDVENMKRWPSYPIIVSLQDQVSALTALADEMGELLKPTYGMRIFTDSFSKKVDSILTRYREWKGK